MSPRAVAPFPLKAWLQRAAVVLGASLVLACGHALWTPPPFTAVVEKVEYGDPLPVQYYTPSKGLVPPIRLILRLEPEGGSEKVRRLDVIGLGEDGAWARAKPGDRVRFRYAGPLPTQASLPVGQLLDFQIVGPVPSP